MKITLSEPRPWGESFSFYTVTIQGMHDDEQRSTALEIGHSTTAEGDKWSLIGTRHQADTFTGIMKHVAKSWPTHQHQINGWARDQKIEGRINYDTFKMYASSMLGVFRKACVQGNETKAERVAEEHEQLMADYPQYAARLQAEEAAERGDYAEEYTDQ